jgi:RHS repeat-associated protein
VLAVSSFDYDNTTGRLLTASSPQNLVVPVGHVDRPASVTVLGYNTDGLPNLVQDPLGHQVTISYNALAVNSPNLVVTLTYGDASTRQITLDPVGRTLEAKDEKGVRTQWTYNPKGQVKSVRRAVGTADERLTVFNYDCRGDLYRVAPPSGGVGRTLFMYRRYNQDGSFQGTYEGQVTRINYSDGTNEYFGYNSAGELAWRKKADGTIVTIASRDAQHRIAQIDYPASGGNAVFSVTASYDEFGRVTSTSDSTGTSTAVYDVLNRPTSLTPPLPRKALTYAYTKDTTLQRWITTVTATGVGSYQYQADTKGRLAQVVNPFSQSFSLEYDQDGKNTLAVHANGVREEKTYTARDWLASVLVRQANGTALDTLNYYYTDGGGTYDPTGHLRREVDAGSRTHSFFYDNLYELTQEIHPDIGTVNYGYDANGNRISRTAGGVTDYYGVDDQNKLLWVNRSNNAPTSGQTNPYTLFSYDLNGHMTHRDRKVSASPQIYDFFWDGDDRLRSVKEGATTRFSANYDGDGLRVFKSDSWTGNHDYSWGPGGVLHDTNGSTVYTPGLAQRQGSTDRFLHSDWVGSTRYLSDSTGNSFPAALRFDAFRGRSATGGTDPYHSADYQFAAGSGYQTEDASATEPGLGLQYLQQRYYDPAAGRFITSDPIGLAGGLNAYRYAGNDPANGVDPSGLYSVDEWRSDFWAGVGVVTEFGESHRVELGMVGAGAATGLTGNPVIGFLVGGLITTHLSLAGGTDPGMAVTEGMLAGYLGYEGAGAGMQATAAYQYRFGSGESAGCPNAGMALSGRKGGWVEPEPLPSQRAAYRAAMRAAGIGRNGEKIERIVPLQSVGSRSISPQGDPGVRTEWENRYQPGVVVHHDPYGNGSSVVRVQDLR